jgi:lysyl endopeptidase
MQMLLSFFSLARYTAYWNSMKLLMSFGLMLVCGVAQTVFAADSLEDVLANQSMRASDPLPYVENMLNRQHQALFVGTTKLDFSAALALKLTAPTDAEKSKLTTSAKKGKASAIGFRRAIDDDKKSLAIAKSANQLTVGSSVKLSVTSPTARALRVAIDLAGLANDAILAVRGSDDFERLLVAGTVGTLRNLNTADGYWTPVTQGETQYIELQQVGTSEKYGNQLILKLNAVSHISVPLTELNVTPADDRKIGESGSCQINAVCLATPGSALAATAASVAIVVFTRAGDSFICTGTLLNSVGTRPPPYFYTADHCIDGPEVASTINSIWFYDAPNCSSRTTVGAWIQLTGGATYIFSDDRSDASLIHLNNAPPAGAVFAGWSANAVAASVPVTGIHHPAGDVKKISRGSTKTGCPTFSTCVGWTSGSTEPGSSGSGLFIQQNGQYFLTGGLEGGASSCANTGNVLTTANTDRYSRLSFVYGAISGYLTGTILPPPMPFAINDNLANATIISGSLITAKGNNAGATKEIGEPTHPTSGNLGGASVWWNWTAPSDGTLRVNTIGSSIDTLLAVYTGSTIATLKRVSYTSDFSDDIDKDNFNYASSIEFDVVAGVSYKIAVDGYLAANRLPETGPITLNLQLLPALKPITIIAPTAANSSPVNRYRINIPSTGGHLYTTDANEYRVLTTGSPGIYIAEGIDHKIYQAAVVLSGQTAVPFFRLYINGVRQHFWTADMNEYLVLRKNRTAFNDDGTDGYLFLKPGVVGTVPLYRLVLTNTAIHHWTTDENEFNFLRVRGWTPEGGVGNPLGVTGYVVPK